MAMFPNIGTGAIESYTFQQLGGEQAYVDHMLGIYHRVAIIGTTNFMGARIQLSTNLHTEEWRKLATNLYQHQVVYFLQFGFHVGSEGPLPSPSYTKHTSARDHPREMASYICVEIQHRAIMGPFSHPSFTPLLVPN